MKQQISCRVEAFWDSEAEVWVAIGEDVPGLATEADTIESLTQKLRQMIPELMLLNGIVSSDYAGELEFQLTTHR
ncbi:MAG: DUF1902 domain-containing protein, partial [Okeania sp. SIO2H7]|nr:DUF1902 domain-containing protein [Okeania sp. SIO2H7]